jgi:phosphoserine phosphatase
MNRRFSLVFFDVDSTLVSIEGIDVLAGGNPEIQALTEAAMNGSLSIDEVYARRLDFIKPTQKQVARLAEQYLGNIVAFAEETVRHLLEGGVDVHFVTAGIEQAVWPLAAHMGLQRRALHAVRLDFDKHGRYRDFDRSALPSRSGGKEAVVLDVRARSHGPAMFVGDGMTDLEAKDAVDVFVGFGGVCVRDRVREEAAVFITDLREILAMVFEAEPDSRVRRIR